VSFHSGRSSATGGRPLPCPGGIQHLPTPQWDAQNSRALRVEAGYRSGPAPDLMSAELRELAAPTATSRTGSPVGGLALHQQLRLPWTWGARCVRVVVDRRPSRPATGQLGPMLPGVWAPIPAASWSSTHAAFDWERQGCGRLWTRSDAPDAMVLT